MLLYKRLNQEQKEPSWQRTALCRQADRQRGQRQAKTVNTGRGEQAEKENKEIIIIFKIIKTIPKFKFYERVKLVLISL